MASYHNNKVINQRLDIILGRGVRQIKVREDLDRWRAVTINKSLRKLVLVALPLYDGGAEPTYI